MGEFPEASEYLLAVRAHGAQFLHGAPHGSPGQAGQVGVLLEESLLTAARCSSMKALTRGLALV